MKIIAYKMIKCDKIENMKDVADQAIKEGWQPYGFPFMGHGAYVIQAMVKYEENMLKNL